MEEKSRNEALYALKKSKFVRTVFLRMVLIFLIVIVAVIAIVFFSFTSEIRDNTVGERQKQLDVINETISQRMEEVASIAYNIGTDEAFYLESVQDDKYSGTVMSKTLGRYLVGNDFIEHLAYYRLADPDIIYTSSGELSIRDFLSTYLKLDSDMVQQYVDEIQGSTEIKVSRISDEKTGKTHFTYVCPLPQFSKNPQAFVLMLIPDQGVKTILEPQLSNCSGEVLILDADGEELYQISNLEEDISVDFSEADANEKFSWNGDQYIVQKSTSASNGWTYVSVIRMNDIFSGVAGKQLVFIILLLILMLVAIFTMLMSIVKQYKPISNLAVELNDQMGKSDGGALIDEESLLSDTFASLKDDSEQKQMFEAAYYEADAANKAKSTFLSNMSHDIRTPMNAIVGMTELAEKHTDDPVYVRECLQNVSVASQYLLDIINNVLDMSRIESGQFSLSEDVVELPKLVYGIITILNHSVEVKSQKLIVAVDHIVNEKILGDNIRLSQIFINILSNAVKFTPNGGSINFHISQTGSDEDGYGDYTFVISDTGIGMSKDFIQQVFDTFTRDEKAEASRIEGTGLGMAIAKNFVDLMGGTISCESELGKGTTFTVKMHMKLADRKDTEKVDKRYDDVSILVLGDEEKICANQVDKFRSLGAKAEWALSLADALSMTKQVVGRQQKYDFVIINQVDYDKSGIVAVSQISKEMGFEETTYVLAARDAFAIEKSRAYDAGISVFVQRPLFMSTVIGILDKTINLRDAMDDDSIVNLEGRRILLVEDNKINRQIAYTMLSETKASIYEAENGKEAVDAFKAHEAGYFDIILMDVQMPIMNGYDATVAIRSVQREDALTIPIYAMTANTYDEDVRQVKEAGMNGHLGKPYSSRDLYRILDEAIRKS